MSKNKKLKLSRAKIEFSFDINGKEQNFTYIQQTTKQVLAVNKEEYNYSRTKKLIEITKENIVAIDGKKEDVDALIKDIVDNYDFTEFVVMLNERVGNEKERD